MKKNLRILLFLQVIVFSCHLYGQPVTHSWRYYTVGNTGIQGDAAEGLWIDHDGDPYICAYFPAFENGGFAKFIQSQNKWINYSNVDYPAVGPSNLVGGSRISDIVEDNNGILWMANWRGFLRFDPSIGASSIQFWGNGNSIHPGGSTSDIDVAPDGSIWMAVRHVSYGPGGLVNYNPTTNTWRYWGYGTTANNWPSTVTYCNNLSIQENPGGGYSCWIDAVGGMIEFNSTSQLFTTYTFNNNPGDFVKLPGTSTVDDQNNMWMIRYQTTAPNHLLEIRTQAGQWLTPAQPPVTGMVDITAFKAYGNMNALLVDDPTGTVWHFDGVSWSNKGIWNNTNIHSNIDIDSSGNIWVTGSGGAAKRDVLTGLWQRYRITNTSQVDIAVNDLSIDAQGNVWLTGNAGGGIGGFQKFDGERWLGFNQATYGLGIQFPFSSPDCDAILARPSNGEVVINPLYDNLHAWNGTGYTSLNYPLATSKGLAEDSQNRLWSIGSYYNLHYHDSATNTWTSVPINGQGGRICKDPSRPGTVWASTDFQVLRTDGLYNFSKQVPDFPELSPISDLFKGAVAAPGDIAWIGSTKGLFMLNASTNTYQFWGPANSSIPGNFITPLAYTPDGRIWFSTYASTSGSQLGLCWFDGVQFGIFPVQAGGLPHAQIYDAEVKQTVDGYELWLSCASRGIAVLKIFNVTVGTQSANPPSESALFMQNYPNPFTESTSISFSLPENNLTSISIYDMTGRLVRGFDKAYFDAGTHAVSWDGKDHHGAKVPAGLYLTRLTAGKHSATARMVVR